MDCKSRIKIEVEIEQNNLPIIYKSLKPDVEIENWEIRIEEGNRLVIEIKELDSEAKLRGVLNSLLRQIELLIQVSTEL